MKKVNRTNLTFNEAFNLAVSQSVTQTLVQKGIESGDENVIKGIDDVAKKPSIGYIIDIIAPANPKPDDTIIYKIGLEGSNIDNRVISLEPSSFNSLSSKVEFNDDNKQGGANEVKLGIAYNSDGTPYCYGLLNDNIPSVTKIVGETVVNIVAPVVLLDGSLIKILGGSDDTKDFGGLVCADILVNKINELVKVVNNIGGNFNKHIHASNGVPIDPSLYVTFANNLNSNDFTNKNVTHSGTL